MFTLLTPDHPNSSLSINYLLDFNRPKRGCFCRTPTRSFFLPFDNEHPDPWKEGGFLCTSFSYTFCRIYKVHEIPGPFLRSRFLIFYGERFVRRVPGVLVRLVNFLREENFFWFNHFTKGYKVFVLREINVNVHRGHKPLQSRYLT